MGSNDEFRSVAALLRAGALRAVIDSMHAPEQGAHAFARLESGEQFGKVVIRWA
jgi:NADPH:quinone reductase-like Zn-dependent oxidoreductase